MSLFSGMTHDGLEETEDRLGGFSVHESDIYDATIKMAYATESKSGARAIFFEFALPQGKTYRETVYYTSSDGKNYFMVKDAQQKETGKKAPLPGFRTVDDICLLTTEKGLAEQETEAKIVNVYDSELQKEVPKSVPVLVDLINQPISLGLMKVLEMKQKKEGNDYVSTGEERTSNRINTCFHTDTHLTVVEARNGKDRGEFWDAWLEKNKGTILDLRKRAKTSASGGSSGRPGGSAPSQSSAPTARKSLFGNKG